MAEPSGVDQRIRDLAADTHGVVTRRQMLSRGIRAHQVDYRVRTAALRPLYWGVYAVVAPLPHKGRYAAALFACGKEAVLSHTSAAIQWGMLDAPGPLRDGRPSDVVHVSVPRNGSRRGSDGLRVHRVGPIRGRDRAVVRGLATTAVQRTLLDLARSLRRGSPSERSAMRGSDSVCPRPTYWVGITSQPEATLVSIAQALARGDPCAR